MADSARDAWDRRRRAAARTLGWVCAYAALLAGCELVPAAPEPREPVRVPVQLGGAGGGDVEQKAVPAGQRGGIALLSWNLEWFMDAERGPVDDVRQLNGARAALTALAPDLIALQEIGSPAALAALLAALPGYAGVLSSYDFPQRLALVFHPPFALRAVREIAGLDDAGRPPLEVTLEDERDGGELIAIVVHAKAYADASSWQRRARFAAGLHAYVVREHSDARVLIAGDFNDQLLSSTATGRASPYAAFVSDPRFLTPTAELERAGTEGSTAQGGALLDHIVLGAALEAQLLPGSADVLREELLARDPSLSATVSDHFPVALRLR
jgi:endonuclease/exonuclease/phosphatase family metal-dependent hydrolase